MYCIYRSIAYIIHLKFGDGDDGPNLCWVKKEVVRSTFYWKKIRSGLTLVRSNDIITIKIDNKKCYQPQENKQTRKIIFLKIGPSNGQTGCFKTIFISFDCFCLLEMLQIHNKQEIAQILYWILEIVQIFY